jgi:hypothetical protein
MGYLWTGYVLTWVAMAWFVLRLEGRARAAARSLHAPGVGIDATAPRPENERAGE